MLRCLWSVESHVQMNACLRQPAEGGDNFEFSATTRETTTSANARSQEALCIPHQAVLVAIAVVITMSAKSSHDEDERHTRGEG